MHVSLLYISKEMGFRQMLNNVEELLCARCSDFYARSKAMLKAFIRKCGKTKDGGLLKKIPIVELF